MLSVHATLTREAAAGEIECDSTWLRHPFIPGLEVLRGNTGVRPFHAWHGAYSIIIPRAFGSVPVAGPWIRSGTHCEPLLPGMAALIPPDIFFCIEGGLPGGRAFDMWIVAPSVFELAPVGDRGASLAVKDLTVLPLFEAAHATHPDLVHAQWMQILSTLRGALWDAPVRNERLLSLPVRRVCRHIQMHFASAWSLDDLASECRLSKSTIAHRVPRELGVTTCGLRWVRRCWHAREQLSLGRSPTDAAALAGFADQAQLTRHFKHRLGVTPARYARMVGAR